MNFVKVKRVIAIQLVNILNGTHFYGLKRKILKLGCINVGKGTRVVGPIYIGTVAELTIGNDCFIGRNLKILGNGSVVIGDSVDLAPEIIFITGSHEIGEHFHRAGGGISFIIEVKSGCWIGARATIMGNVTIGKGSVVGASSLVRSSIPDDVIAVGIPARAKKNLDG